MSEAITQAAAYVLIDRFLRNNLYDDDYAKYSEALEALLQPAPSPQAPSPQAPSPQAPSPQAPSPQAPSPQAPGRRKGPPGITLEPQGHEPPAVPVAGEREKAEADAALYGKGFIVDGWRVAPRRVVLALRLAVGPMTDAARDALGERQRQISDEQYEPEADDEYDKAGALILAEIERLDRAKGITAKAEGGA